MASSGYRSSLGSTPDLDNFYQQLKDVDSMEQSVADQIDDIKRRRMGLIDGGTETQLDSTHPSNAFLEQHLKTLSSFKEMLEDNRRSLRKAANECSRLYIRPLTILDMPNEILIKIFGYVKGWGPDDVSYTLGTDYVGSIFDTASGVREVKNLRLTCWRFCNASSHLLLCFVGVEIDSSSLSRLEEISCHPTISKGVRGVEVIVDCYKSEFADDIFLFAEYSSHGLRGITGNTEETGSNGPSLASAEFLEGDLKASKICDSWEDFVSSRSTRGHLTYGAGLNHLKLLRRAHKEYKKRFADQESLLENGTLVRAVATAFSRMPTADRLELCDNNESPRDLERRGKWFRQPNDDELFVQIMQYRIGWQELPRQPVNYLLNYQLLSAKSGPSLLVSRSVYRLQNPSLL